MKQQVLEVSGNYAEIDEYFEENDIHSFLLVCGSSLQCLKIGRYFEDIQKRKGIKVIKFSGFQPNPSWESVIKGIQVFKENACGSIVGVGGGSAIDVAKCIKLYGNIECNDLNDVFKKPPVNPMDIKLLAVPTTAGSGSEATKYAVIYYRGEKQSIAHEDCIPETVVMDSSALVTLPLYQKKSAMLDALCHGIESFWSVNSTYASREYSKVAITKILENMSGYLGNDGLANRNMQEAAYTAGKAINITQTTAGHAMCYKLTTLYGIAHGHAAALCVSRVWPWMLENLDKCADPRGYRYLESMFRELSGIMGAVEADCGADKFEEIIRKLGMGPANIPGTDYESLCESVNAERLKNNPVFIGKTDIDKLYHEILEGK